MPGSKHCQDIIWRMFLGEMFIGDQGSMVIAIEKGVGGNSLFFLFAFFNIFVMK